MNIFYIMQVQYGGRVTDDFDKRLLCTFTSVWFSEALLTEGFKFYEGYPLPDFKTIEEYLDHIINMPLQDIPEVFGLHSNADIYDQSEQQDAEIVCTEGREAERTIVYTLYT